MTVAELKEHLNDFPDNAKVYAYEGEGTGIIIRNPLNDKELAFLETEAA